MPPSLAPRKFLLEPETVLPLRLPQATLKAEYLLLQLLVVLLCLNGHSSLFLLVCSANCLLFQKYLTIKFSHSSPHRHLYGYLHLISSLYVTCLVLKLKQIPLVLANSILSVPRPNYSRSCASTSTFSCSSSSSLASTSPASDNSDSSPRQSN